MNNEFKNILKKYLLVGLLFSVFLLIINSFVRASSFPPVEFGRSLIYYIPFIIIGSLLFLLLGFMNYKLKIKNFSIYHIYIILAILFLIFLIVMLLILYIMNFALSFLGSF